MIWYQKSAIDKRLCARGVCDADGGVKQFNGCLDFLLDLVQDASSERIKKTRKHVYYWNVRCVLTFQLKKN